MDGIVLVVILSETVTSIKTSIIKLSNYSQSSALGHHTEAKISIHDLNRSSSTFENLTKLFLFLNWTINWKDMFKTLNDGVPTFLNRKHSSRMRTDHALARMSSDRVAMRPIVDRMSHACENITFLCGR